MSLSKDCQLNEETKKEIKQAKKDFAKGNFYTLKEVEEAASSKV